MADYDAHLCDRIVKEFKAPGWVTDMEPHVGSVLIQSKARNVLIYCTPDWERYDDPTHAISIMAVDPETGEDLMEDQHDIPFDGTFEDYVERMLTFLAILEMGF